MCGDHLLDRLKIANFWARGREEWLNHTISDLLDISRHDCTWAKEKLYHFDCFGPYGLSWGFVLEGEFGNETGGNIFLVLHEGEIERLSLRLAFPNSKYTAEDHGLRKEYSSNLDGAAPALVKLDYFCRHCPPGEVGWSRTAIAILAFLAGSSAGIQT